MPTREELAKEDLAALEQTRTEAHRHAAGYVGRRADLPGVMNALLENQAVYRDLASTAFSVRRPVLDQHHLECRRSRAVDLRDRATVHITRTLATKGLEFDFVVLAEPRATERRVVGARAARTTYVGITRAVDRSRAADGQ